MVAPWKEPHRAASMPKDCMYLIHEGELRALVAGDGGRVVELNTLTAGELFGELMLRLVQRVRTLTRTVGRLASVDVYGRLVGLFDALAVDDHGQRVVPGPLSQQRIAERVGASKAMVNRLLTDLAKGGYIEVSRERIVLLKKLPPKW